jgi:phytoene dehydrogenase-like protein
VSAADAVVVGAGPNGLAAAVVLARAGLTVLLLERDASIGGGTKTEALTLPGFAHDVCSTVHPLGADSPLFTALPLAEHGLEWIEPPIALAHPLDRDAPALLVRDIAATARSLGADAEAYRALMDPIARHWHEIASDVLAPLHVPAHPLRYARFGMRGLPSAARLAQRVFMGPQARALIGGIASHAMQPLDTLGTAAIALVLLAANHRVGWPIARGGSSRIATALGSYFTQLGGRIETGTTIRSFADLPPARAVLFDLTPRQLLQIAGDRWPARYRRALARFRYGPGVFKVDWALAAPVPWRDPAWQDAGTLHLAGSFEEIAASEAAVARGEHPERPVVLLVQSSNFDRSRAPDGAQTLWGYCHVPAGSTVDMLPRIEAQIERFAPRFRERVLARHVFTAADIEVHNPNMVGGDIGEGANTLRQLFFRPVIRRNPYRTPTPGMYICSSSTPPGGGVHGLCGYHAARVALQEVFGMRAPAEPAADRLSG